MDLVQLAARLAELGWAVLFILLVVVISVGLWRRWWAPAWVITDRDKRIAALEAENAAWRRLYLDQVTGKPGERDPFAARGPDVGLG